VANTAKPLRGFAAIARSRRLRSFFCWRVAHISVVLTSFTATGAWYRSFLPQHLTLAHYRDALTDELAVPSVLNSIRYAALATALAVIIDLPRRTSSCAARAGEA